MRCLTKLSRVNGVAPTCGIKTVLHPVFSECEVDAFAVPDDEEKSWTFDAGCSGHSRRNDIVDGMHPTHGSTDNGSAACGMLRT